jgi:hypothetical protein
MSESAASRLAVTRPTSAGSFRRTAISLTSGWTSAAVHAHPRYGCAVVPRPRRAFQRTADDEGLAVHRTVVGRHQHHGVAGLDLQAARDGTGTNLPRFKRAAVRHPSGDLQAAAAAASASGSIPLTRRLVVSVKLLNMAPNFTWRDGGNPRFM